MPKGHAPKREAKKPKKKLDRRVEAPTEFTSADVQVVPKRRKPSRDDEG